MFSVTAFGKHGQLSTWTSAQRNVRSGYAKVRRLFVVAAFFFAFSFRRWRWSYSNCVRTPSKADATTRPIWPRYWPKAWKIPFRRSTPRLRDVTKIVTAESEEEFAGQIEGPLFQKFIAAQNGLVAKDGTIAVANAAGDVVSAQRLARRADHQHCRSALFPIPARQPGRRTSSSAILCSASWTAPARYFLLGGSRRPTVDSSGSSSPA